MLTQNLLAEERTESNARIGLSSESRWPRHQTNLEAFIAASTDPDTVAAVGDELGIVDLEATGSYVEGVFVVDLDVSGEIGADVTTASEMLIEQAIEQVTTDIDGNDIIELEVLQATLITVNEDLAATAAPLDRLEDIVEDGAAELETDWTFAAQTAWDEDRDELADLVATRNTLENRQRDLTADVEDLERSLLGARARLFVVAEPSIVAADLNLLNDDTITQALVGIAVTIAAAAAFLWFDRQRGRIYDDWQVEEILGLPVLATTDASGSAELPASRRLVQAVAASSEVHRLGIWSGDHDSTESDAAFSAVSELLAPLTNSGFTSLSLIHLSSDADEDSVAPVGTEQCDMVVSVVAKSEMTMGELSERTRALSSINVPMLGVVLAA